MFSSIGKDVMQTAETIEKCSLEASFYTDNSQIYEVIIKSTNPSTAKVLTNLPDFDLVVHKTIDYLKETNPVYAQKFVMAYYFLQPYGLLGFYPNSEEKIIMPYLFDLPNIEATMSVKAWDSANAKFTPPKPVNIQKKEILRHNDVELVFIIFMGMKEIKNATKFEFNILKKQFDKCLKIVAKGIEMWLTLTSNPKYITINYHKKDDNLLYVRGSHYSTYYSSSKLEYMLSEYKKKHIPNLEEQLIKNRYIIKTGKDWYYPLKPINEIENFIKTHLLVKKKCPICGVTIDNPRKDTKVCKSCYMRFSRLKKIALEIVKKDQFIEFSLFKKLLKKEKNKKDKWLISRNRGNEIWSVKDWTKTAEAIWGEIYKT